MSWYVACDNQQLGVFPEEEIKVGRSSGRFLPTDLVWKEGQEKWQPAAAPLAPPPVNVTPQTRQNPSTTSPAASCFTSDPLPCTDGSSC